MLWLSNKRGFLRTFDGRRGAGRPKLTWKKLMQKEKTTIRSAIHAASQLPGRGPTDVNDAPAPAR